MWRAAVVIAALAMPPLAMAAEEEQYQAREWTDCASNEECVVIPGTCSPAAVNVLYKDAAAAYFKKRAETVKCVKRFWEPKIEGAAAHCRVARCEIVGNTEVKKEKAK